MAKFQLSVSKTFVVDTNDWGQAGRDVFAAALAEVAEGTLPPAQLYEGVLRGLLEDDDFWDAHIDLDEINPGDVRVVCIDPTFEPYEAKSKDTRLPAEKIATAADEKLDGLSNEKLQSRVNEVKANVKAQAARSQEVATKSAPNTSSNHQTSDAKTIGVPPRPTPSPKP